MSFLDKLRERNLLDSTASDAGEPVGDAAQPEKIEEIKYKEDPLPEGSHFIEIDLRQDEHRFVLFAQMAGVGHTGLDVSLEGDNDVLVIKSAKNRPEVAAMAVAATDLDGSNKVNVPEEGRYLVNECKWGGMYRKVVLPREVIPGEIEAHITDGILALTMPFADAAASKKITVL